jgi:hypothetical protein
VIKEFYVDAHDKLIRSGKDEFSARSIAMVITLEAVAILNGLISEDVSKEIKVELAEFDLWILGQGRVHLR